MVICTRDWFAKFSITGYNYNLCIKSLIGEKLNGFLAEIAYALRYPI
jgi:hypothetical protein